MRRQQRARERGRHQGISVTGVYCVLILSIGVARAIRLQPSASGSTPNP